MVIMCALAFLHVFYGCAIYCNNNVTGVFCDIDWSQFDFCRVVQVHIGTMRATSRGYLTLQSADPTKAPVLDFNYLATEDDVRDLRACIPIARQVCSSLHMIVSLFLLLVKLWIGELKFSDVCHIFTFLLFRSVCNRGSVDFYVYTPFVKYYSFVHLFASDML